jgi:hypothetical protein
MNQLSKFLLRASFIGTFAETMLVPLYTVLTNKFGGGILDAGIGYAIFNIVTGVFVATIGSTKWFERNIKNIMFWGFLVAGICDLSYLLVQNKYEFWAVQLALGISVGMLNPAWDALFSEDANEDESHGKRWSFWTGGINFVQGTAALLGALIVTYLGFNWVFIIMAACDAGAVYYSCKILKFYGNELEKSGNRLGLLSRIFHRHDWDHLPIHRHGKRRRVCRVCRLEHWEIYGRWKEPRKDRYSVYPQ